MASYVRKRSVSASLPHVARASRRMSEHLAVSAAAEKQPWLLAQASRGGNGDVSGRLHDRLSDKLHYIANAMPEHRTTMGNKDWKNYG